MMTPIYSLKKSCNCNYVPNSKAFYHPVHCLYNIGQIDIGRNILSTTFKITLIILIS